MGKRRVSSRKRVGMARKHHDSSTQVAPAVRPQQAFEQPRTDEARASGNEKTAAPQLLPKALGVCQDLIEIARQQGWMSRIAWGPAPRSRRTASQRGGLSLASAGGRGRPFRARFEHACHERWRLVGERWHPIRSPSWDEAGGIRQSDGRPGHSPVDRACRGRALSGSPFWARLPRWRAFQSSSSCAHMRASSSTFVACWIGFGALATDGSSSSPRAVLRCPSCDEGQTRA